MKRKQYENLMTCLVEKHNVFSCPLVAQLNAANLKSS